MSHPDEATSSHLAQFIHEFESTPQTPEAMLDLLPIWKDTLLLDARTLTGKPLELLMQFVKLCEDFSTGSGDETLLKLKIEEVRLMFSTPDTPN